MTAGSVAKGPPTKRLPWLDVAKAMGMFLIWYGHIAQKMAEIKIDAAAAQFQFIYSFHLPLFFALSGYVSRERNMGWGAFIKLRLVTRIVPAVFFNLLLLTFRMGYDLLRGQFNLEFYLHGLAGMLRAYPVLNFLTWFLFCLFTVEMIHFALARYLRSVPRLIVAMTIFYTIGWLMTWKIDWFSRDIGIPRNFWYIHEAGVAYAFYLLGVALKKSGVMEMDRPAILSAAISLMCFSLVLVSFPMNTGPFHHSTIAVVMSMSRHGHFLLFPFTAAAGTLGVMFLSRALWPLAPVLWIGRNTLMLLGLNAVFFDYINRPLAVLIKPFIAETHPPVMAVCTLVTLASMALTVPLIHLLNRWLPQLVGKPTRQGPILNRLL